MLQGFLMVCRLSFASQEQPGSDFKNRTIDGDGRYAANKKGPLYARASGPFRNLPMMPLLPAQSC